MTTQVFDDGSSVTYDDAGNITSIVNSAGATQFSPPSDGSALTQQFASLFHDGIQAVGNAVTIKLKGSLGGSATPGTPAAQAKPAWQKYVPLALLGVGGFAAFHLLKR